MPTRKTSRPPRLTAQWIWCAGQDPHDYNLTALFQRQFTLPAIRQARLRITADSGYRLLVNGRWINDGPARAYPEHWLFDEYDLTPHLKRGSNTLRIIARYYGVGTFHQIPQHAGLLAQLDVQTHSRWVSISTDKAWQAAPAPAWQQWVPKVSIQMEPAELYDARLESTQDFQPAVELFPANRGPWKNLTPRPVAPLAKTPCSPAAFRGAAIVRREPARVCVPVARLAHPGLMEANYFTSRPVGLASVLQLNRAQTLDFNSPHWIASVDGQTKPDGRFRLKPGQHRALFFCNEFYGHRKELPFPFLHLPNARWMHPYDPQADSAWVVFVLRPYLLSRIDRPWISQDNPQPKKVEAEYRQAIQELARTCQDPAKARRTLQPLALNRPDEQVFLPDFSADFAQRQPRAIAARLVRNAAGPCQGNDKPVKVHPAPDGDVELCYDLGQQRVGYLEFALTAPAGVTVDLHLVEHINPDGQVQHSYPDNRNGLRYITRQGRQRFTSLKRRSGRYLFLTLRGPREAVELHQLRLIESTAPVKAIRPLTCSDATLSRVWQISARTLQLCMEDVFTDCPLYEQTLWIGDARNAALYAYDTFGNTDVSRRSLELGAQSLDHFPMVGCQVPSAWNCLLPAWSFLWGIQAWEYYFYTGDKPLLKSLWPALLKNLKGAWRYVNPDGLFSAAEWNLFDWADIDQEPPTVLHNSLFFVGALQAAQKAAEMLGHEADGRWIADCITKLKGSINRQWDPATGAYPDSIHVDGKPSPKRCQHTSLLALLYDVAPPEHRPTLLSHLLNPPAGMTRIGSPFAMQFLFEALEQAGQPDAILQAIRQHYAPMLRQGATTVWEHLPSSPFVPKPFPTRSHCHAWSAGPLYFLNRLILGLRQCEPGGRAFGVSPWVHGLTHARGAVGSARGPVFCSWRKTGRQLTLRVQAPAGVRVHLVPNASLANYTVRWAINNRSGE